MNELYQISKAIRHNAQQVLKQARIEAEIRQWGELFYTGSYALDLMTWNDIDMQVVFQDGVNPMNAMNSIAAFVSHDVGFIESKIINFSGDYKAKMPRGIYLGLKLNYPEWGGMWKLDVWSLAPSDFEANRSLISTLGENLDRHSKRLILEMKHEMMAGRGRVPQMASHFLYQAILLDGIREKEDLYRRFTSMGIRDFYC